MIRVVQHPSEVEVGAWVVVNVSDKEVTCKVQRQSPCNSSFKIGCSGEASTWCGWERYIATLVFEPEFLEWVNSGAEFSNATIEANAAWRAGRDSFLSQQNASLEPVLVANIPVGIPFVTEDGSWFCRTGEVKGWSDEVHCVAIEHGSRRQLLPVNERVRPLVVLDPDGTPEHQLALAVLRREATTWPVLVDCLVEQGRVDALAAARIRQLRHELWGLTSFFLAGGVSSPAVMELLESARRVVGETSDLLDTAPTDPR